MEYEEVRREAEDLLRSSGVPVLEEEYGKLEVVDFALGNVRREGLQILTMYETQRMAGRILVMLPRQTEPEHWHPPQEDNPGKQEIIRALWGEVRFYLDGEDSMEKGFLVEGKEDFYTLRHEVVLSPGETLILEPGSKHWFQAGEEGAVFYSFSTVVRDAADGFTDPGVIR